jgi:hypothetical protein
MAQMEGTGQPGAREQPAVMAFTVINEAGTKWVITYTELRSSEGRVQYRVTKGWMRLCRANNIQQGAVLNTLVMLRLPLQLV